MDIKKIAEDLEMEPGQFLELLVLFLDKSNADLKGLEAAMKSGDNRRVVEISHSIKGAAGNLRISDVYEIAKDIESKGKESNLDCEASITVLRNALDGVDAAINQANAEIKC